MSEETGAEGVEGARACKLRSNPCARRGPLTTFPLFSTPLEAVLILPVSESIVTDS